jgi:hypothetical protein
VNVFKKFVGIKIYRHFAPPCGEKIAGMSEYTTGRGFFVRRRRGMRSWLAMALRRLADRLDGLSLVWVVEYIKGHPDLTATEVLERSIARQVAEERKYQIPYRSSKNPAP